MSRNTGKLIELQKPDLLSKVFYEEVDETMLRRCITYLIEEKEFQRNGDDINQGINPAVYFEYLKNLQDGKVEIKYTNGGGDRFGLYRKYASVPNCKSCGACHFMREIRAALYKDAYIDLDIVNAYPNFMYSITKGKYLGEYINNRDVHLKEVMDTCHVSRDTAKRLFLMIGFGGNYKTWYSANANNVEPAPFVVNYYNEMQTSRRVILEYFHKFAYTIDCIIRNKRFAKDPKNKTRNSFMDNIVTADSYDKEKSEYEIENSAISRCLQFLEVNLIREVYKKLQEIGIDVKTCIYCFDGCMIKKSELEKIGYTTDMLCEVINQYVHGLNFYIPLNNINFISKEFEQNNFDPMKYEPTTFDSYEEYLAQGAEMTEFPEEDFNWNTLRSLKQGDRIDHQTEYLNKYVVYDIDMSRYILRKNRNSGSILFYKPSEFKYNLARVGCEKLIDYIQIATRRDDIDNPRKWLIKDKKGNLYYNLFMGINPEIKNGKYIEEIGKDFEEFVNTFAYGEMSIPDGHIKEEYIEPLKRVIGSLACHAGYRLEIMVCIVSAQGYGKDTLFDIISKWYDPEDVAKSTPERLFGNFNIDAGKCLVLLDECCDRGIQIVNNIKNYVTATDVTVNHKYGSIETKTNKSTVFLFGNSTQGIPVEWETADRRALFYNLQNVPIDFSKAKAFLTKWSNHPSFYSSCYHKACEWFDPKYDFHRNISTNSKYAMQSVNMPFIVEAIYTNRLFERYTATELKGLLEDAYGEDLPKNITIYTLSKELVKQFGNGIIRKSNGKQFICLYNVKELIEQRYHIKDEDKIDYCEL